MKPEDLEKLSLALVSAYVWVASSDEGVDLDEFNKFQHVILESPFATQLNVPELRHSFKDMVKVFETNYDYGIELTRQRLKPFADEPMQAQEIIRLARAALVADAQLKPSEENVLSEITKELEPLADRG